MTKTATVLPSQDPRHGQYAGYQAGCRLSCCWTARRRYDRARAYDVNAGRARVVDATAAREHIARCVRWGVRYTAFGAAATNAPRILRGDIAQIHTGTEAQILAVQPRPGRNCFAAFAATRRLRALVALGHAQSDIARAAGLGEVHVSMLVRGSRGCERLAPTTWAAIDDVFRAWSMTPGTSTRSRHRAERHGWLPPLAFDDIDDPDEQPTDAVVREPESRHRTDVDPVTVARVLNGERLPCTVAERREVTRLWTVTTGRPLRDLAEFTGWKPERYRATDAIDTEAVAS